MCSLTWWQFFTLTIFCNSSIFMLNCICASFYCYSFLLLLSYFAPVVYMWFSFILCVYVRACVCVQWTFLMILKKVGIPRPLPLFWGSKMETVKKMLSVRGWDGTSAAEELSHSLVLAGVSDPETLTPWKPCRPWGPLPCCCSCTHCYRRKRPLQSCHWEQYIKGRRVEVTVKVSGPRMSFSGPSKASFITFLMLSHLVTFSRWLIRFMIDTLWVGMWRPCQWAPRSALRWPFLYSWQWMQGGCSRQS